MVLLDLATYLENEGYGTKDVDIFYGIEPSDPDVCTMLHKYSSLTNEPELGGETVRLEFPLVQVVTRGITGDYDGPEAQIKEVVRLFTKIGDEIINGTGYLSVLAKHSGFLKRDANFRVYHFWNFEVSKNF